VYWAWRRSVEVSRTEVGLELRHQPITLGTRLRLRLHPLVHIITSILRLVGFIKLFIVQVLSNYAMCSDCAVGIDYAIKIRLRYDLDYTKI